MDKKLLENYLITAHKHSLYNRDVIEKSDICGCFHCISIYPSTDVTDWEDDIDENGEILKKGLTAWCPKCGIDSVIGSASGFPIEIDFLKKMRKRFFW